MIADVVIDPLKIYQRLKAAKLDEKAAKEIASIFGDVLDTQLATKKDIAEIQKEIAFLKKDMKEMEVRLELKIEASKSEMLKWIIGLFVTQTGIILTFFKLLK